ncbi:DUF1853 family protein [Zobellella maritima]|uniref:DUF1853 family protein n=1 Tax=Zobellella maritima TaxID=2059725 RepID=UPI000E300C2A|nr:DUF1853 family protein [Zobellella maritima]
MSTLLSEVLTHLQTPVVRDLAWALGSPNLLGGYPFMPENQWYKELLEEYEPRLYQLDRRPELLISHTQAHRRLGQYFESLWHFYLLDSPRFQLVAHNWQQIEQGITLGAFDFILWDNRLNRFEHWEMAVKFYLITDPDEQFGHALGTNTRDRLQHKLEHMSQQQLPLSQKPTIAGRLKQQGTLPEHHRLILKGRLYYPHHCRRLLCPEGERGVWGYQPPADDYRAQHKLSWLTGHSPSDVQSSGHCYLGPKGNWYFFMAQDWPDIKGGR